MTKSTSPASIGYRAAGWTEAGQSSGHRRAGRDYYQPGAGLKSLWLKALRPQAAVLLRGPDAMLPAESAAARPVAAKGVVPVKLRQLDGKAVTDRLAQVVSIVSQETGATVAVAPVLATAKEHEVPAARALLEKTALDHTLVSLDAGHANHDTARTIVQSGGDYLIQLKDNCPAVRAQAAHAVQNQAPLFSPTTVTMAAPNTAP